MMASIKNKIARSKANRAGRKATNKALATAPVHRTVSPPSIWSMWMLSRGNTKGVSKRFLPKVKI
jgi:hypothetical protein